MFNFYHLWVAAANVRFISFFNNAQRFIANNHLHATLGHKLIHAPASCFLVPPSATAARFRPPHGDFSTLRTHRVKNCRAEKWDWGSTDRRLREWDTHAAVLNKRAPWPWQNLNVAKFPLIKCLYWGKSWGRSRNIISYTYQNKVKGIFFATIKVR